MFKLHPRLEAELIYIGKSDLSQVFVLPNSDNPWVVLVPEIADIKELHHLEHKDQVKLLKEINSVSSVMEAEYTPDKINIGALGNMVPQLHIHIIARYKKDKAWPGALWGTDAGADNQKIKDYTKFFKQALDLNFITYRK